MQVEMVPVGKLTHASYNPRKISPEDFDQIKRSIESFGMVQSRRKTYNNRKLKALQMIGSDRCIKCGCDVLEFLEINHIGGGGSKEIRSIKSGNLIDKILNGTRSVEGLNVLCRVCNALDHLYRKNLEKAKNYSVIYCNFTGADEDAIFANAVCVDGTGKTNARDAGMEMHAEPSAS